jgi:hypothetical protein
VKRVLSILKTSESLLYFTGKCETNTANIKQYRQCTYNVILRRVRKTIVAVEKHYIYIYIYIYILRVCACMCLPGRVCVCMRIRAYSVFNPARNAYAPYCDVICVLSGSTTFF